MRWREREGKRREKGGREGGRKGGRVEPTNKRIEHRSCRTLDKFAHSALLQFTKLYMAIDSGGHLRRLQ